METKTLKKSILFMTQDEVLEVVRKSRVRRDCFIPPKPIKVKKSSGRAAAGGTSKPRRSAKRKASPRTVDGALEKLSPTQRAALLETLMKGK